MPLRGCLARGRGLLLLPASRESKPKTRVLGDQTIERGDSAEDLYSLYQQGVRIPHLWHCSYGAAGAAVRLAVEL
jgi:hypothetical protein